MIKSNLRVKLAENNLKITRVYNDTGISRSTLTMLADGDSKGVQFDTLNTLCRYLKITPSELFLYSPVDFSPTVGDFLLTKKFDRTAYQGYYYTFKGVIFFNFDTNKTILTDELNFNGFLNIAEIPSFNLELIATDNSPHYVDIFKNFPRELYLHCEDLIKTSILNILKEKLENTEDNRQISAIDGELISFTPDIY